MKKDKYELYKPEAFRYEEDEITPGFIFGLAITLLVMTAIIILFVMLVAGGAIIILGGAK